MSGFAQTGEPGKKELLFLSLGGAGEIGMNLNLYGHAGAWLMVDLGITFGDDETPGIDVIMPDPTFIEERVDTLAGLVLTHAHEDHIGAVPYLWRRLRCPLYATPFTASILRRKLAEAGLEKEAPITEIPLSGRFDVGPFNIELITLTHSIPEPNACVIRTGAGTVMHTGDWKLDPDPRIGPSTDEAALIRAGEEGILAMVCDSTNVLVEGTSGSEGDVRAKLTEMIGKYDNRIVVACFASNVARLDSIAHAAAAHDRSVGLVGRSLWRFYDAAQENGYLTDIPRFLSPKEANLLPRDKVVLICTGSQGEPRAALSRIARNDHSDAALDPGDVVIFSSRVIPGNEKSIGRLQNRLTALGVDLLTTHEEKHIHVSGHPARDELAQMYQWVRPKIAVPVHGEERHMRAHAKLAQECQVPEAFFAPNGTVLKLAPGPAEIVDEVFSGRLALDGSRLISMGSSALRERRKMLHSGAAVVTVIVNQAGELQTDPQISTHGVFDLEDDYEIAESLIDSAAETVEDLPRPSRRDDDAIREAVRVAVRRKFRALCGKRPKVDIHLIRL
ncbi:MAG: MBL fold metallo-hydrolase [Alphaproteobacteria bacterium]|nr:MBL fold metallo-hydrolase [Alphaproteobacteria bacterium]